MPTSRLREFLDSEQVNYEITKHPLAYTAQEIAAVTHTPGKELAKSVIINMDGELTMLVLPASHRINFSKLKQASGATRADLASEQEFETLFPDCQLGAMPPFGNLYGLKVLVDQSLAEDEEIAFNACNHLELMRLSFKDFERLVKPQILKFTWKP
jgi:Ala-tRNA(Pro) deacylase